MSSLISMKEDCRKHFRFKAKEIYAKLIKKFGYDLVYSINELCFESSNQVCF